MPRCSECGTFNPVHLERCERCGAPLTPFSTVSNRPYNEKYSIPSREPGGKGRVLLALLTLFLIVTLIVSITIGYVYFNPGPTDTSSVPEIPNDTGTATLNISLDTIIGVGYHVIVSINEEEIANLELGPTNATTDLGSYNISVGSEKFLLVIANIYNESMELLYTDWLYFWAIGGESYDISLHPIPINIV